MKKLRAIVIGCLIVLAGGAISFRLKNRAVVPGHRPAAQDTSSTGDTVVLPGQAQASDSSALRAFQWQFAGISIQYPATWSMLSWGSSAETASRVELISSPNGIPKYQAYFCVDLSANPASSDLYQLRSGRVVASLGRGLFVYQEIFDTAGLPQLKAWLTTDDRESVIFLPKGKSVLATVTYRCVGGDAETPTLTAEQQESSSLYEDSLDILRSLAASISASGDQDPYWTAPFCETGCRSDSYRSLDSSSRTGTMVAE
jgi:hypothetical protein